MNLQRKVPSRLDYFYGYFEDLGYLSVSVFAGVVVLAPGVPVREVAALLNLQR